MGGVIGRAVVFVVGALGQRQPKYTQGLKLPGLLAPIEIVRDEFGVAHCYAQNITDLFFAQGFVTAQDRFWQFTLLRQIATGRLSELFGDQGVPVDKLMRTLNFKDVAQKDLALLQSDTDGLAYHTAFAAGINAYVHSSVFVKPLEFSFLFLSHSEDWTVLDTLTVYRFVGFQMSMGWFQPLLRRYLVAKVGTERAKELNVDFMGEDNPPICPKGANEVNIQAVIDLFNATALAPQGQGSNSWAISGRFTESGRPILASDPHLKASIPSSFYQLHLSCPELDVHGCACPGLPGIIIGHNQTCAWGATLGYADCTDIFMELLTEDKQHYIFRGEQRPLVTRIEEIKIRGRPSVHYTVQETHHGPLIHDLFPSLNMEAASPLLCASISSTLLHPSTAPGVGLHVMMSQSPEQFGTVARAMTSPCLSVSYADTHGNIAYWLTGKVPVRSSGDGTLPIDGTGSGEWTGFIPANEMPHALNPEQGFIVMANHNPVGPEYPHYLGRCFRLGLRAKRINDEIKRVIREKGKIGVDDVAKIQMDVTSYPCRSLAKRVTEVTSYDADVQWGLDQLKDFDGGMVSNSVPATICEVLRLSLERRLYTPQFGPAVADFLRGEASIPNITGPSEFYSNDIGIVLRMLDNPNSYFVAQCGGVKNLVCLAMRDALTLLTERLGSDRSQWTWGKFHNLTFEHPMGVRISSFSQGPFEVYGNSDTPCHIGTIPSLAKAASIPVVRMVVDMADIAKARIVLVPGQCGHVGSRHYADNIQTWLKGQLNPMLWTRADVEGHKKAAMTLTPEL